MLVEKQMNPQTLRAVRYAMGTGGN